MNPNDTQPKWVSVMQAAYIYSVHPNTIRNLIRDGKLKASRLGRNIIRISMDDLNDVFTPVKGGEHGIWNS